MKKSTPSPSKRRHPKTRTQTGATVDLAALSQEISALVASHAVDMVTETIGQVEQGHYQALRFLFEMVGLFPIVTPEPAADDSLAATLLHYLGVSEQSAGKSGSGRVAAATARGEGTVE